MLFGKHDMLKAVAELGTEKILFFNDLDGSLSNAACRLVAQSSRTLILSASAQSVQYARTSISWG